MDRKLTSFGTPSPLVPLACFCCLLLLAGNATASQEPVTTIRGIVRDTDGTPVPGAEVFLEGHSAQTTLEGRFILPGLAAGGPYLLTIRKIGYSPLRAQVIVSTGVMPELEYVLTEEAARLPTVIVDAIRPGIYGSVGNRDLQPLIGASVEVRGPRGGHMPTDSLGRFAFPRATGGHYLIRVTHPGFLERRMMLDVGAGGRELTVVLLPGIATEGRLANQAVTDLGQRLVMGMAWERISPAGLNPYGGAFLCDIPRLRNVVSDATVVIINGVEVLRPSGGSLLGLLCSWRADEVDMVEFGPRTCADVTGTLASLIGVRCGIGGRRVPRSISGAAPLGGSGDPPYIVIWERR